MVCRSVKRYGMLWFYMVRYRLKPYLPLLKSDDLGSRQLPHLSIFFVLPTIPSHPAQVELSPLHTPHASTPAFLSSEQTPQRFILLVPKQVPPQSIT